MNIAGSFLEGADQDLPSQLDDALVVRHPCQAFRSGFGFLDKQMLQRYLSLGLLQNADGGVFDLDGILDFAWRAEHGINRQAGEAGGIVEDGQVRGSEAARVTLSAKRYTAIN